MVLFNYSTKELTSKIVYYGPGLCGKTTNLQFVYDSLPGTINKGKMLSLATRTDRTLFFDFLPIDLGMIRGMRTRLQLYTVPGQVFYNTTRKLVLKGADGVVFVADSQERLLEQNLESLRNLEENLLEHGMNLSEMPLVIQFNKRDLPEAMSIEALNAKLNRFNAPIYEAVATTGIGVHETLKAITRLVLNSLKTKYADKRESRPNPAVEAAARAVLAAREVATATIAGASARAQAMPAPFLAPEPIEAPVAEAPPPQPTPEPIEQEAYAEASAASPVALLQEFEEPPDLSLPEPLDLDMGISVSDLPSELEEVDLSSAPMEATLAPEAVEDDFLLELATEDDQLLSATTSADEVLELAEILTEDGPESGGLDPLLADLNLEATDEDPLDLPDLRPDDPLGPAYDSIESADSEEPFYEASHIDSILPPVPESQPAEVVTPDQYLSVASDSVIAGLLTPPQVPSRGDLNRYSRFEEDRASLILDDFDPTPLPLSHDADSHHSEAVDHADAESFASAPVEAQDCEPVVAIARSQAALGGEINLPLSLSIGDQKIHFELKITLDMISGVPKLASLEAKEERA